MAADTDPDTPSVDPDLLRSGLAHLPVGIGVTDASGILRYANPSFRRLLRLDAGNAVGRSMTSLSHPDDQGAERTGLERLQSGEIDEWEGEQRRLDGDGRSVHVHVRGVRGARGELHSTVRLVWDIPNARRTAGREQEAETRLGRILGSLPLVLFELRLIGGRVEPTWASPSVERVLGYPPEETLSPEWWVDNVHPDDREEVGAAVARLAREKVVGSRYRLRDASGRYRWVEDELFLAGPFEDGGHLVYGMLHDVTAAVRAEERVRAQEERFHRMVERRRDIIALLSPDGTIFYDAPADMRALGYEPDQVLGTQVEELVHPDDRERLRARMQEVLQAPGTEVEAEVRLRHRDGSWRILGGTLTNLLEDPVVRGILVNARDVTERRQTERELRQAQKLEGIGTLTAGIVHDLNNVLSVIRGASDLLALDAEEGRSVDIEILDDIRAAAQGGETLVRKLLAFGHAADLEIQPVDLREKVDEAMALLRRLVPASIEMVTRLDSDLPSALADPDALTQILINLATNARDAMPDGGTLEITAQDASDAEPPRVLLRVRDTGEGMDQATLERVFDPFFTTKPVGKGTGLGMSTVHGLVRQQGGELRVESSPGSGTIVHLDLPVTAAPATPVQPEETAPRAPDAVEIPAGAGETTGPVVFVDDVPQIQRTGRRILERLGFEVHTAEDGLAALDLIQSLERVHLVISDGDMPRLDGLELYARVRERWPGIPFLLSSGSLPEELGAPEEGPLHFVQKPWSMDDLKTAVARATVT